MPQVATLIQELEGLVHYAARRYGSDDHPVLNHDDLAQEGWAVFSKLISLNTGADGLLTCSKECFVKQFKTSLFNRMCELLEIHRYTKKRTAEFVELDEETAVFVFDEIAYYHYCVQVKSILKDKPDAICVFENLLEPCEAAINLAMASAERKNKLKEKGLRQRGAAVATVKQEHIRIALGIQRERFAQILREIKSAVLYVVNDTVVPVSV